MWVVVGVPVSVVRHGHTYFTGDGGRCVEAGGTPTWRTTVT